MLSKNRYISVSFEQSELKARNRDLSFLLEMSNFLTTQTRIDALLEGALSKVLNYFDLQAGRIYLIDDRGRYLYLVAHQGMEAQGLERLHISEGFTGKSARTKSFIAQQVSELEDEARAAFLLRKGLKIIICVPLITMDRVVGVMNLAANTMIRLNQEDIDLFTVIANQIAVAAENAKLYGVLKDKIESLGEKNEMIKFFAYAVSHDLKSPATAIYGLAKRLREKYADALDEKGRIFCEQLLKVSKQVGVLVENLNAYMATRECPLSIERIKIEELVDEIRSEFSTMLEQRGIRWSQPEILPEILAERVSLSRVFRNFIDNALKHGGEDLEEIKIGYQEEKAFHIFSVSDDGIGIKKGNESKVFDMFQRYETSKGTTGSGLGLTIVKEIAERHGGQVWVHGNGRKGTVFSISISKALVANG